MKKNVVLIGASGFVGSAILEEALSRGHHVKAVVRDPEKIKIKDSKLKVVQEDIMDEAKLAKTFKGHEYVISAYNPGWKNPNIYEDTLRRYTAIINDAKEAHVRLLLEVGGAGSSFVVPGTRLVESGSIPDSIRPGVEALSSVYIDMLTGEEAFDWVFFAPSASLEKGKRTGNFRLGNDRLLTDKEGNSRISVQDYAMAMVDELEKEEFHMDIFTAGY